MKKKLTTFIILTMCLTSVLAQKSVVWERPQSMYSELSGRMDVSRVVFADTATVVTLHFFLPNTPQVGFPSETMLQADGRDYKVKSIKGFQLNAGIDVPKSGELLLDMIFEPVPSDVPSFAFTVPHAFSIKGIRDRNARREGIADTYWRDEKTGDWLLGVGKADVVYNSKMWHITSQSSKNGSFTISASHGSDVITINISKEKKGLRTISVGKKKAVCSMITSEYLPDYPTKDTATLLADNSYRIGDSITIVGWYKDMPEEMWEKSGEFEVHYYNIFTDFTDSETTFYAKLDSLGCFTLRMPIQNTQMLYCDWRRSNIMLIAEPGETYFLLKDFAENKTLVMGSNARLQNECLGHDVWCPSEGYREVNEQGGIMAYLANCDSIKSVAFARLAAECEAHPALSARYENLGRNQILCEVGCDLMQARFGVPNYGLPKEYVRHVTENYWNKIEGPYTSLGNRYTCFFRDYYQTFEDALPSEENLLRHVLLTADKEGKIKLSDADRTLIDEYAAGFDAIAKQIAEAPDSMKQQLVSEFNEGRLVKGLKEMLAREGYQDIVNTGITLYECQRLLAAIQESPDWSELHRDMVLSTKMWKAVDQQRKPLQTCMLEYADANITLDAARRVVHEIQEKYEAIYRRTLDSDNIKSADDVKDMSDGQQMLQKILEPYKGKIVLLDIWGTWCGPCKEALSHSQEEYEQLKDYPMAYLYLANRSPEDSWKSVIKEYNITGDNVAHYNLPDAQQTAIENYLNVHSFPTYKLFDQQGRLLDVNADPRDIQALKGMIRRLVEAVSCRPETTGE